MSVLRLGDASVTVPAPSSVMRLPGVKPPTCSKKRLWAKRKMRLGALLNDITILATDTKVKADRLAHDHQETGELILHLAPTKNQPRNTKE